MSLYIYVYYYVNTQNIEYDYNEQHKNGLLVARYKS